jgi:hypothetical protein
VAYHVEIPKSAEAYLAGLSISNEARRRIEDFLFQIVGNVSDDYRNDPANRPLNPSGSRPYFKMQFVYKDAWGDNRSHQLDAFVSDAHAAASILRIVYLDDYCPPLP